MKSCQPIGGSSKPLVSVVIPCYKQARFLGEAIESVLAQTYPHFEVIVVDDDSPDNTSEVALRYPEVHCVWQENRGLSAARNAGLRESKGDYVVFLDADDRLLPHALEVGLECLKAHPACAFVSGRCRRVTGDGSPLAGGQQPRVESDPYVELLRGSPIFVPAVMYRRFVFESVGGFDTSLKGSEDYDLYYRIAREFPIYCHDKVVAEYRRYGAGMTSNSALMLSSSVATLRSQREYVKRHKQYKEAYKAGIRRRQGNHGARLADELRAHMRDRRWNRVLQGLQVLLRYYPQGLALLLISKQRIERRRYARRLLLRRQELEVYEQWLKKLEGAQKLESALIEERQEVQQLRQRIRRLERRIQSSDQRSSLLKKLSRIRADVLRK